MKTKLLLSKKSKFILSFLIFFTIVNVQAQYTLIPDANFEKQLIQKNLDDVIDGKVLTDNINTIEDFAIYYTTVEDITGIEDFTALKDLTVYNVELKKVDLSHNKALESINFGYNNLVSFDLSQNTALKRVYISDNMLSTLDLSNNPNLEDVFLGGPLVNLNMANGHNEKITRFSSQNASLLSCIKVDNLDLTTVTVTEGSYTHPGWQTSEFENPVFSTTDCGVYTPIADAVFEQTLIDQGIDTNTTLDKKVLTSAIVNLQTLDLNNGVINNMIGISDFKALQTLKINESAFYSIDMSQNSNLKELRISNNKNLERIDVSKNENLEILRIYNTGLTKLDISKNPKITELYCNDNNLNALNLKNRADNSAFSSLSIFTGNAHLSCIEVDDVDFATSKWLNKDVTASYYNAGCPTTVIPDPKFEQVLIDRQLDDVIDGKVATGNIAGVDYLYVSYNDINDLTGIEDFASLTTLEADGNNLSNLDLSNNKLLKSLRVSNNQLNTLNVSKNSALNDLNFNDNKITTIDITNNTALQYLFCSNNKITKIDISQNHSLTQLGANDNSLVNLNIKGNTNNIYYMDLRNNPYLSCIEVDDISFANNGSQPQWYKDAAANYSEVACAQYTAIQNAAFEQYLISNVTDEEGAPIDDIADGKILTSKVLALQSLTISAPHLSDVSDIGAFTELKELAVVHNSDLTTLDVSKNINLTSLSVDGLNNLDVTKNTALTYLNCSQNRLSSLDVSKNTALTQLYCSNNQLTALNVAENTALIVLDCDNNQLTSLDVSNNKLLIRLNCYSNQLTTLDISQNNQLTNLNCQNNNLKTVNLRNGNNTNLETANVAKSLKNNGAVYPIGVFGFQGNDPALVVLVDNKSYSDTNWMAYKDASAVYLENISLGTGENTLQDVSITPNPTQGELYINNITLDKVTVITLLGNIVKTINFKDGNTSNIVDLSDLTAGLYLVKISSNGLEKTVKVLKK
jgi:Leucine-rich repeat (LRR) protein